MASSRGSFERGSKVVDRLRTEQKVDTESDGPATMADHSAESPHRNSRAAHSRMPDGGPLLLGSVPKPGVRAWSFLDLRWR